MPLNLYPVYPHPVTAPADRPARSTPAQPVQVEQPTATVEQHSGRSAKRSAEYVAALRELREEQLNPRHNIATRTYLQIAHYEGDFQLVDVYT